MKKILSLFAAVLMCIGATAQDRTELIKMVGSRADAYPQDMGNGCKMLAPEVVDDNLIFTIETTFGDALFATLRENKDAMVATMTERMKVNPATKSLLPVCYATQTNIVYCWISNTGRKEKIVLPWQTLGTPADTYSIENTRGELENSLPVINRKLPIDYGDGIVLSTLSLDGDNLVCDLSVDLDAPNMMLLKQLGDATIAYMREQSSIQMLIEMCKESHCNMVFRFTNPDGQSVSFTLPYSQM